MTKKIDKFDNLIRILQKELKLTSTEIAETLWLAMHRQYPSSTHNKNCLLYTSPSPRDGLLSRMPSSA